MVDEPTGATSEAPATEPIRPAEPPRPLVLRRSRSDRVFAGVCGGLGHYLGIDAGLVRIAFVILIISTGFFPGIFLYVVAWLLIPEEKPGEVTERTPTERAGGETARFFFGVALVVVGGLLLLGRLVPWLDAGVLWALVLIAAGVMILAQGIRR